MRKKKICESRRETEDQAGGPEDIQQTASERTAKDEKGHCREAEPTGSTPEEDAVHH